MRKIVKQSKEVERVIKLLNTNFNDPELALVVTNPNQNNEQAEFVKIEELVYLK